MATSSFDKNFVVRDPKTIDMLQEHLAKPAARTRSVTKERDYKAESARGIELLNRRLSALGNG